LTGLTVSTIAPYRVEYQTIKGADGQPAFVVIPYEDFVKLNLRADALIPHEVVSAMVDGENAIKAWREYLGLDQAEVAGRTGITQAALAQIETAEAKPGKKDLRAIAAALGITLEQLDV
jgi:DNA-binding XRE family transcriptional regulator